jgi:PXA domain
MTAHPPLPPHWQPSSKASSTAKSTRLSAIANSTPTTSRSSSQVRPSRTRQNANSAEYTSGKATATLIRRVLGPQTSVDPRGSPRSIEDILPPLTSSNEVDLQLYAIIAIVVKDFVQIWYSKITPDHVFVEEVVQIIAHCSRAVEQSLRRIDIEELVFDELPALVEAHILGKEVRTGGGREALTDRPKHTGPLMKPFLLRPITLRLRGPITLSTRILLCHPSQIPNRMSRATPRHGMRLCTASCSYKAHWPSCCLLKIYKLLASGRSSPISLPTSFLDKASAARPAKDGSCTRPASRLWMRSSPASSQKRRERRSSMTREAVWKSMAYYLQQTENHHLICPTTTNR